MTVAEHQEAQSRSVRWLKSHPGLAEFGIVGACLLAYFLIRGGVVDRPSVAFAHAIDVIHLEQRLGFFWEPAWQHSIQGNNVQIQFWNAIYFWAHAPVLIALALWLYFRHLSWYRIIRNAFLFSCIAGLFLYAVYPVAPPRLMTHSGYQEYGIGGPEPQFGFVDTMEKYSKLDYQAESLKPFVNPFAALPSLHFGWAFLIGVGVYLAMRNVWGMLFAVLMPGVMFFGVVLTANHFIFDAITGLAVCLAALGAAALMRLFPVPWRRLLPDQLRWRSDPRTSSVP